MDEINSAPKRMRWSTKSVQEVSKHSALDVARRHPKTDVRYWQDAIFRPTYSRNGQTLAVSEWMVKIQHRGRRENFPLDTSNRAAAAARAKDIYLHIVGAGWEAALQRWKPPMHKRPVSAKVATVGEFLTAIKTSSTVKPKTLEGYAKSFRMIVAQVSDIPSGKERFDYRTGGNQRWQDAVHSVGMDQITSAAVQQWKASFLKSAGSSPLAQKTARVSVNSFIRNAKALFAPKLLAFLTDLTLPDRLPFAGITFEKPGSLRYRSTMHPEILLVAARDELGIAYPEQFKIFVLALLAGLRRNEIDKLLWRSVDFQRGVIRIEATEYFQPKSEDSAGDVEVDPEMMEILREYKRTATGPFVVNSHNAPRPGATFNHYRAAKEFERLNIWLRAKGVTGRAPLHVLRKEFGSLMTEKFGIYAASRALRHSRLEITSAYYTDTKSRKTLGLGSLISSPTTQNVG